ncbi:MAG TPA: DUF4252 domain-containing protein [Chitinophagaceae bacterium]|nr:DUF4252 domain-containing protein [Chitinophagaceae bacterium]
MKKTIMLLFSCLLLAGSAFGQHDAIQKFFGKYLNDSRFTVIYVSPRMFRMFSKMDWDSLQPDVRIAAEQITSLRILTTEVTPMQFYQEASRTIDTREYEPLITIRDKSTDVKFLAKEQGDSIQELLMLTGSPDNFCMMSFVGNIRLDEMAKLGKALNVKGIKYLKDVK